MSRNRRACSAAVSPGPSSRTSTRNWTVVRVVVLVLLLLLLVLLLLVLGTTRRGPAPPSLADVRTTDSSTVTRLPGGVNFREFEQRFRTTMPTFASSASSCGA